MKRTSVNSRQSQLDGEEARVRFKYQGLLEEYLELQKEFVSKKRKFQAAQQNKKILLAEVKFLRQRHRYLSKIQSQELEVQNPCSSSKMPVEDKDHGVHEAVSKKAMLIPDSNLNLDGTEKDGSSQQKVILKPRGIEKKPKNCLINGKREGKKKISWQDQVVSRVEFSETEL